MKTFSSETVRSAVSSYQEHPQQQQHQHQHNLQMLQQPTASQMMSKNRRDLRKRKQMARKFGTREIVIVQSLIERCLTFYATKEEVMEILEKKCGIDEVISSVIWDKLEKENEEFFKEYYKRLKMKERIEAFNEEICTYAQTIGIIPTEVEEEEEKDDRNTMSNDENVNHNNNDNNTRSEAVSDNTSGENKQRKKKKKKKSKTTSKEATNNTKNNTSNKRRSTGALSGALSATLTPLALAPGELRILNDHSEADLPSMELSFEEDAMKEEEKDEIPLPRSPAVAGKAAA